VQEPLDDLMTFLAGAFLRTRPIPVDGALTVACAARVTGNARLTPAEQTDIYRQQFWLRHIEALREDYPGLVYILGEDGFESYCEAYLAAFPPSAPSLRDLGHAMATFAPSYTGFPPEKQLLAVNMVRYEHAMIDVFDGADPPPLDPETLRTLPDSAWETARILLHPLLVRMQLDYPVHLLRSALRKGDTPGLPDPATSRIVLFRKHLAVCFEPLEPDAFALLEALGEGEPLVPACNRIAANLSGEAASRLATQVGGWFQQWAAWGWIAGVAS
jgi:hypothetical protein